MVVFTLYVFNCVMIEDERLIDIAAHQYAKKVIIPRIESGVVTDANQMKKEVGEILNDITLRKD